MRDPLSSSLTQSPGLVALPVAEPRRLAVSFRSVSKAFGSTQALVDVSLGIEIGTTLALLGPNGAGKTTSISIMLGLLSPSSGEARILDRSPSDAIGLGHVGAMLQSGGLPNLVTVAELIDLQRALYPLPMTREAVLRTAGLTELAGRRIETLSGGESQRVRFALAIAGNPDLVFLDEPTVGMDVETRHAFWASMRVFAAEGRTVLFATHYLEEADQVADRVVLLDRGRVIADGTPGSIKSAVSGRTVRFTLAGADEAKLAALPGVTGVEIHGNGVTLHTDDADSTVRTIYRQDLPIRDIEVTGADLEAAFMALTNEAERK
jgi:ABC-2 type transport system ATP-binding protein